MRVEDALRSALGAGDLTCVLCDHGVARPLVGPWPARFGDEAFAGLVRTVEVPRGGLAAIDRALDDLEAGRVLFVRSGSEAAVWGGRLSGRARERGAAGVVVDGRVRDVPTLRRGELPLLARGVAPHRSDDPEEGAVDAPVDVEGVRVHAGDALVVDANGAVVVPHDRFGTVVDRLGDMLAAEAARSGASG